MSTKRVRKKVAMKGPMNDFITSMSNFFINSKEFVVGSLWFFLRKNAFIASTTSRGTNSISSGTFYFIGNLPL